MKKGLALILAIIMTMFLSSGYADGIFVEYSTKPLDGMEENYSDCFNETLKIITNRLDSAGIKGYAIKLIGAMQDAIRVEIPVEYYEITKEVLELISAPGKLTFTDPDGNVFMDGDMVESAEYIYADGYHQIAFKLTEEGTAIFADMTSKSIGRTISIYLDDELLIAPVIQQAITDGSGVITGIQSEEQARRIAAQIQSGALRVQLIQDYVSIWSDYKLPDSDSSE